MNKPATFHRQQIKVAGIFLLLVILMFLCSGCKYKDNDTPPTDCLFTQISVKYSEEDSQISFATEVLHTETSYACYYFEQVIDGSLRQSCMEATDKILANLGVTEEKPSIYIFSSDTFCGVNVVGHALYTPPTNWESADYVTNVILAVYGDCTHYGLAFGYSTILCERLGWDTSPHFLSSIPDDSEIYDLNLLCFDNRFVSKEDVLIAEQVAYEFASFLTATYGDEEVQHLLSGSNTYEGMENLRGKLSEFYSKSGIDHSSSLLRFGYGGISYDYILKSELGKFCVGTQWQDINNNINPLVSDNFLHENYPETKAFFERNLCQMDNYQNLFNLDTYNNDLTILFPNSNTHSQYSYYQSGSHQIFVYNVDSLMHEYIHSLTNPSASQQLWETEGFARFFSYMFDYYGIAFLNADYNNVAETKATEYVFEFKETIQRPIDMETDFQDIENIAVYSRGYTDPNASYVAGSSFVQYLVRIYGAEFVVQCIYGEGYSFTKPFQKLVHEWNLYIEENYSNFSRYNDQ